MWVLMLATDRTPTDLTYSLPGSQSIASFSTPSPNIPDHLLWKITGWPEARSAWSGRRHLDLQLFHEKYGDVVRIGPEKLSFHTSQALNDIYTDRKANMIKTGWTHTGMSINQSITTQLTPDRQLHAARRKLLNNAFSERAMNSADKHIVEKIRLWCAYIGGANEQGGSKSSSWGKDRDMGNWSTFLTVDVLGELCFGASFKAIEQGGSYIMSMILASARFQQSVWAILGLSLLRRGH